METCVMCHSPHLQKKSVIIQLPDYEHTPFLVPAHVCGNCGERYIEEQAIKKIEQKLNPQAKE